MIRTTFTCSMCRAQSSARLGDLPNGWHAHGTAGRALYFCNGSCSIAHSEVQQIPTATDQRLCEQLAAMREVLQRDDGEAQTRLATACLRALSAELSKRGVVHHDG